jgi:tRNA modification GTPase
MLGADDTIAAVATAKGVGALSIVRISGSNTGTVIKKCFKDGALESHRATLGVWKDPVSQRPLDEVITIYFADGKSFTGEEAAEIICHGGIEITQKILGACLESGCRLASPGEFTYRAVMSGKMDLVQAESVLAIIQARSEKGIGRALKNLKGALSEKLTSLEERIIFLLAHLEATIDFTTEDIDPQDYESLEKKTAEVFSDVEKLVGSYYPSQRESFGISVVFAGRPNVGKSSLFNGILDKERSIVHNSPGTTRDTVEAEVVLGENLFKLVDTAGLRQSESEVENQGVERTKAEIQKADVVIYVLDSSACLSNEDSETIKGIGNRRCLVVFNKSDLKILDTKKEMSRFGMDNIASTQASTIDQGGIETVKAELKAMAVSFSPEYETAISSERQHQSLRQSLGYLKEALFLLKENKSPDLVALPLKSALLEVQATLGKTFTDEILDKVFKEFCIGK